MSALLQHGARRKTITRCFNTKKKGGGIGDDLYDGAATFGRFMSWVSVIIGTLISVGLIAGGATLLRSKQTMTATTTARVTQGCATAPCEATVTYQVNGTAYNKTMSINRSITAGETFTIRYDPNNPYNTTTNPKRHTVAIVLLAIGAVILVGSWISWYIAQRFKFAAAATGVGAAWNIVT